MLFSLFVYSNVEKGQGNPHAAGAVARNMEMKIIKCGYVLQFRRLAFRIPRWLLAPQLDQLLIGRDSPGIVDAVFVLGRTLNFSGS